MAHFWLKVWIWIRVVTLALATVYLLSFIIENQGNRVKFWYFPYQGEIETSSLKLAFFAFFAGMIATVLIRTSIKTLRQIRASREQKQLDETEAEKVKAAMLRTRQPGDSAEQT